MRMNDWYVSPKHLASHLAGGGLDVKIAVFEEQMRGWILNHARALTVDQNAGYAILILATTYFEPLASYVQGVDSKGKTKEFFRFGFLHVFEELEPQVRQSGVKDVSKVVQEIADECYVELRCGLFHEAMAKNKVAIYRGNGPSIQFEVDKTSEKVLRILVDPWSFLARVESHLAQFVAELHDPNETMRRTNFEKQWDFRASRT